MSFMLKIQLWKLRADGLGCSDDGVKALATMPADSYRRHTGYGKHTFQAPVSWPQLAFMRFIEGTAKL